MIINPQQKRATLEQFMERLSKLITVFKPCNCCPGIIGLRCFSEKGKTYLYYCDHCRDTSGVESEEIYPDMRRCPCHYHGSDKAIDIAIRLVEEWNSR